MTTYANVLSKKERIIELVKLFGYSDDINIKYDVPDEGSDKFELTFIVKKPTNHPVPHKMKGLLEAILTSELGYAASVIDYAYISSLDQDDTDIKSAPITDELAIKKVIYRISKALYDEETITVDRSELDKINFADIELKTIDEMHEYDRFFYEGLLKQAEEYLRKIARQQSKGTNSSAANAPDENHSDSRGKSRKQTGTYDDTYAELRESKRKSDNDDRQTHPPISGSSPGKNS